VVGDGDVPRFRRIAERFGLNERVHFTGGRDDLERFYRAADLLIHPARVEAAGHVLLEALVSGLPVLVTENCGYAAHVAQAESGLICPHPFEQRHLNELLLQALASHDLATWRTNALRYASQTDLYSMIAVATDLIIARAARNQSDCIKIQDAA